MKMPTVEDYPYGHPFWIHIPERAHIVADPWAMLDLFQSGHAFVNGINGRSAHPDSYMTVLDYDKARSVFDIINAEYSIENSEWVEFADYFINHVNRQPITTLLGMHIKRLLTQPKQTQAP